MSKEGYSIPPEIAKLQADNAALREENEALRDTFAILRDFVEGRRHDTDNITKIINGALRLKT